MLAALSHADHWSRTNLRAGDIGVELSHTQTAVAMSEVGLPQVTEMPFINVYGWFWADCAAGVRRPCTRSCAVCELIVRKRGALLSSYPRALVGYLCHLVCWGLWSSALSALCCWVQWQAAAGAEFELTGAAAVCRRLFAVPK